MATSDDNFAEFFTLAQAEALTARESYIVDLGYGFVNGEPHTLEQVGEALGVSRERIRQILQRVHRKISSKGKRQITKGQTTGASARLLLYLKSILRLEESGNLDRIFAFATDELAYCLLRNKRTLSQCIGTKRMPSRILCNGVNREGIHKKMIAAAR